MNGYKLFRTEDNKNPECNKIFIKLDFNSDLII